MTFPTLRLRALVRVDQQPAGASLLGTPCTTATAAITAVLVSLWAVLTGSRVHVATSSTGWRITAAQERSALKLTIGVIEVVRGVVVLLGFDELGIIVREHLDVVAVLAAFAIASGGGGDRWWGQVQKVLLLRGNVCGRSALP
jgi:hypothetical protein